MSIINTKINSVKPHLSSMLYHELCDTFSDDIHTFLDDNGDQNHSFKQTNKMGYLVYVLRY